MKESSQGELGYAGEDLYSHARIPGCSDCGDTVVFMARAPPVGDVLAEEKGE